MTPYILKFPIYEIFGSVYPKVAKDITIGSSNLTEIYNDQGAGASLVRKCVAKDNLVFEFETEDAMLMFTLGWDKHRIRDCYIKYVIQWLNDILDTNPGRLEADYYKSLAARLQGLI
jgi:hypothetical protein